MAQTLEETLKCGRPPFQKPGYKIFNSCYRDNVVKILLMNNSLSSVMKYLQSVSFPCDYKTVLGFRVNYLSQIDQATKDKLINEIIGIEKNNRVACTVSHVELSKVESIIVLIKHTEEKLSCLQAKTALSSAERVLIGQHIDRILRLRQSLELARFHSEVETERHKAIEEVASIAIECFKDSADCIEKFIQRIGNYVDRKNDDNKSYTQ